MGRSRRENFITSICQLDDITAILPSVSPNSAISYNRTTIDAAFKTSWVLTPRLPISMVQHNAFSATVAVTSHSGAVHIVFERVKTVGPCDV